MNEICDNRVLDDGKIGGLPESCIIDNKNKLTLDQIDLAWYVALAHKYITDYVGGK